MKTMLFFMFFSAWFIMLHAQSYWSLTGNSNVTNSNFIGHTIYQQDDFSCGVIGHLENKKGGE